MKLRRIASLFGAAVTLAVIPVGHAHAASNPATLACASFDAGSFKVNTTTGNVDAQAWTKALAGQKQPKACGQISYVMQFETWGLDPTTGTAPLSANGAAVLPPGTGTSLGSASVSWGANGEPVAATCPTGQDWCTTGTAYDTITMSAEPNNGLGTNQDFCVYIYSVYSGSPLNYIPGAGTPAYNQNNPPWQRACYDVTGQTSGGVGNGGGYV